MLREAEDDIRPEPRGCQINQGADKSRDVFIQSDTADGIFTQGSSTRHSRDVMLSCRVVARGLERTRDARRTRIDLTPTRACARSSATPLSYIFKTKVLHFYIGRVFCFFVAQCLFRESVVAKCFCPFP